MHVNVTIVGLDRVSASVGLALKRYQDRPGAQHSFTIIGNDPKAAPMKTAQKIGAVDNFHRALLKATDNADLIVLNPPFHRLEETFTRLGPELKPGAVVLDLSQLKQPGIELARQHFPTNDRGEALAYLVGVTPVVSAGALFHAGVEVEDADAALFDKAECLLTPDSRCPSEAISLAEDIVRLLGGKTRFMDPAEHDGLMAATEQLPALLGAVLFFTLMRSEGWVELRRMVNPTLALATQSLRHQSPDDLRSLFAHNRDTLAYHLETLIGVLDQVRDLLVDEEGADPDGEQLAALLALVGNEWEKWDMKRHSGKWEDAPDPREMGPLPGPLGAIGSVLSPLRRVQNGKSQRDDED